MAKNRSPKNRKFKPGDVRKYRVALTEAQIKRNIAILDKAIQDGDDTKTTESLRYNLNYVYIRIIESELGSRESRKLLEFPESQMGSEPRSGSDSVFLSPIPQVITDIQIEQVKEEN